MKVLPTYRRWFWKMTAPLAFLLLFSVAWSVAVNFAMYRALGVSVSHVDGSRLTIVEELFWSIPSGIVLVLLMGFTIALVMCVLKRAFRWWVVGLALLVVGSPTAILGGGVYLRYLWRHSSGGTVNEDLYPVTLAFLVACVLGFVVDGLLDYRARALQIRRAAAILCPACGYDLRGTIAAGSSNCSECGQPFELVRVKGALAPTDAELDLSGIAARPPKR